MKPGTRQRRVLMLFAALGLGSSIWADCPVTSLLSEHPNEPISVSSALVKAGDALFMRAIVNDSGFETLYRTNGTPGGTGPVLLPEPRVQMPADEWVVMGQDMYMYYRTEAFGVEVWRVTSGGTASLIDDVAEFEQGDPVDTPLANGYVNGLTTDGNFVYYIGRKPGGSDRHTTTIYRTNGEPGSTQIAMPDVSDPKVGPEEGVLSRLGAVTGKVFFPSGTSQAPELWVYESGEYRLVADLPTLNIQFLGGSDVMFFTLNTSGNVLWRTDGTEGGTYQVLLDGQTYPSNEPVNSRAIVGDSAYYRIAGSLWLADGGPMSATEVLSASGGSVDGIQAVGDKLLISRRRVGTSGADYWIGDPVSMRTPVKLEDHFGTGQGSFPGGRFAAHVAGNEFILSSANKFWRTDFSASAPDELCGGGSFAGSWGHVGGVAAGQFTSALSHPLQLAYIDVFDGIGPPPLPTPGPFSVTSPSGGQRVYWAPITFQWTTSENASAYTPVLMLITNVGSYSVMFPFVTGTSYTNIGRLVPTLDDQFPYSWAVIAENGDGATRMSSNVEDFFVDSEITENIQILLGFDPLMPPDDANDDLAWDAADIIARILELDDNPGPLLHGMTSRWH